ncbi:hypothetical protein CEXT_217511 [Caerostris extrusa]|uniref:Uncharacterized protein n=1 Tax=Caerostris extrusa TaxID=172846 RepID=A0AAV4XNT0_CAEEX|nr:hypothetical protein CEXT_217511 [Caerostris extrusa]
MAHPRQTLTLPSSSSRLMDSNSDLAGDTPIEDAPRRTWEEKKRKQLRTQKKHLNFASFEGAPILVSKSFVLQEVE